MVYIQMWHSCLFPSLHYRGECQSFFPGSTLMYIILCALSYTTCFCHTWKTFVSWDKVCIRQAKIILYLITGFLKTSLFSKSCNSYIIIKLLMNKLSMSSNSGFNRQPSLWGLSNTASGQVAFLLSSLQTCLCCFITHCFSFNFSGQYRPFT